jgi:hydroxyethylthiazole kinase
VAIFGVAGEIAAEKASHPGSFRVAFLDALDTVGEADITSRLRAE